MRNVKFYSFPKPDLQNVQVLTIGMQVLIIRTQNAPAYIYELCVN